MTARQSGSPRRIEFQGGGPFYAELKLRVRLLLEEPGRARRAQVRIYAKSAFMVAWLVASWVGLVFFAGTWWQATLLTISLGLALAGVAFNITHDAIGSLEHRFRSLFPRSLGVRRLWLPCWVHEEHHTARRLPVSPVWK